MSRRCLWTAGHFCGVFVAAGGILYALLLEAPPETAAIPTESDMGPARTLEDDEIAVMRAALRFTLAGSAALVDHTVDCPTRDAWGWGVFPVAFKAAGDMRPRPLRELALRDDPTRLISLDERRRFTEQTPLLAVSRVTFAPDRSSAWIYTMWEEPSELVAGGRDRFHAFKEMRKGEHGWYPATTDIRSDPAAREYWVHGWAGGG